MNHPSRSPLSAMAADGLSVLPVSVTDSPAPWVPSDAFGQELPGANVSSQVVCWQSRKHPAMSP